jgi:DNA repair exonuclease SbcCD ATPase subunit/DNA repair exonuclease SbcCD nuclease subunit
MTTTQQYIFHLSDLHIRNGDKIQSRYDEYKLVFNNTIISIKNKIDELHMKFNEYLIIITGDIFHNKSVIGPHGLLLYRTFIQELTILGRVIVFPGNHCFVQSDTEMPNLLYSSSFEIDNLIVLNESKSFIIDNIGFSYVAINTTLDIYRNSGRIQELPEFPKILEDVKYKIGLFHGTFAKVKLYNGEEIREDTKPYPLEWIKDLNLDYLLLGDVHKKQVFNYKKTICGYSGSLVQQNYGEDLLDHGYLLWHLENKKVEEINIYNNIGYINIKENEKEEILIRQNGKYECLLEDVIKKNEELFPKTLEIKTFSKINFHNLNILLKSYNIKFIIISKIDDKSFITDTRTDLIDNITTDIYNSNEISSIVNDDYILTYFKKMLTPKKYNLLSMFITDKDTLLLNETINNDLIDECRKKNKEIKLFIDLCNKNTEIKEQQYSFKIKYLEWESLLCYENRNWLNMHDLDAKTFLIKARNGTGKSAIYNILLLAIWGNNKTKSKNNINLSSSIINSNKKRASTIVDIEINNIVYRIVRKFDKTKKQKDNNKIETSLNNDTTTIYKFINNIDMIIFKDGNGSSNETIKELFGSMDNFLHSSMITQNVDNDILKLDHLTTLQLIDKYSNVEYIFNLQTLFNTASNKYKDFKRTIENKKQVYEKLLSTNKIEELTEEEIKTTNDLISDLQKQKEELLTKFNSIMIDIKNPKNLIILDTDYNKLITELEYRIINDDEYQSILIKYNELKYLLKDVDNKILNKLKDDYNEEYENEILLNINKPCELSILEDEEKFLKSYLINYNENDDKDINLLSTEIKLKLNEKQVLEKKQQLLISAKPETINKPIKDENECITEINKYYKSIDELNNYISTHTKNNTNNKNNGSIIDIKKMITYDDYKFNEKEIIKLEDIINKNKNELSQIENNFKLCFKKQQEQNEITINIPATPISCKTSSIVKKSLNTIDIKEVEVNIKKDDEILNKYYKIQDNISKLECELLSYKQELLLFTTKDEYKFNPKCKYCCNRPWVNRINELNIIISKYDNDIKLLNDSIENDDNDYLYLYECNEKNKELKEKYHLYNEWYEYYKNKELKDKTTKELNEIIVSKDKLTKSITKFEDKLRNLKDTNDIFNIISFELYDILINNEKYNNWNKWNIQYNHITDNINNLSKIINQIEKDINYNKNIKPRIIKYNKLKELYNEWEQINNIKLIVNSYHYNEYKKLIDTYDKFKDYNKLEGSKSLIRDKLILNDQIKDIEKQLKQLNDNYIKKSTMAGYNNDNKLAYIKLCDMYENIDDICETLEDIITNFQAFKIELYDKYILNNLTKRANSIIKSLCHIDTKPFKLDYYINVVNDKIHINWLINDDINNDEKKIISITQASGFQHFTISLALRMSLFNNKNEILCNQIFIDEGFVNFDKYNLSIVPQFLKSLLLYFNNVIIVSHIDMIQDNIDEIAEIKYNKLTGVSEMTYNSQKKTITKKTKNK